MIAWAERYLAEMAESYQGQAHPYCLYAKVPDETRILHLAGMNPSAHPDGETFRRRHSFDGR